MRAVMLAFMVPVVVSADFATQTDWSGGAGFAGPTGSWTGGFSASDGIDWVNVPGSISLNCGMYRIDDGSAAPARGICAADIDGDGDDDLVRISESGFFWYENPGLLEPGWSEHFISSVPAGFDVGCVVSDDLDGDGDPDLVVSDYWGGALRLYRNFSQGSSWPGLTIPVAAASQSDTGDIDGDGDIDIACHQENGGDLYWCENDNGGGAAWTPHLIYDFGEHGPFGVCITDIDSDGYNDIALTLIWDAHVEWFRNTHGTGEEWENHIIPSSGYFGCPAYIQSGDIDGDDDPDLLVSSTIGNSMIGWCENLDASGTSWQCHTVEPGMGGYHVDLVDLDADGDLDVVGNRISSGLGCYVGLWRNLDGEGTAWMKHVISADLEYPYCGQYLDIDQDGVQDEVAVTSFGADGFVCYDLGEYAAAPATLESSILYLGCDPDWASISWTADTPMGTHVTFQVRASDNPAEMGAWSGLVEEPCGLGGILSDSSSYLQYRVILSTSSMVVAPVLEDVTITWNSLGVHGEEPPASFAVLPVSPNPARGALSITFGVPSAAAVDLSVYDLAGRVVFQTGPIECQAGYHAIQPGELPPGVYLAVGRSEGVGSTVRFTVLE